MCRVKKLIGVHTLSLSHKMSTTDFNSMPADVLCLLGRSNPAIIAVNKGAYVALNGKVALLYTQRLTVCKTPEGVVIDACERGHHDILRYALHTMEQPGVETEFVVIDDDRERLFSVDAERYFNSQVDCRRMISKAVYGAIVGGHVECVRLMLAFARPWLSTVTRRRFGQDDSLWIDMHIDMLLLYCHANVYPYHSLCINPAVMEVINAEINVIQRKERKERSSRRERELTELRAYAEVAEFWF